LDAVAEVGGGHAICRSDGCARRRIDQWHGMRRISPPCDEVDGIEAENAVDSRGLGSVQLSRSNAVPYQQPSASQHSDTAHISVAALP
jgi:hypothetical protein